MRWTEDAEKMLWQTIFNTQSFHLELHKIAEGWPGDEKPTAKALKEHLQKYRKELGSDCKVTFGMTSKASAGEGSVPVTPRKRATPKKAAGDGAVVTPKKRGRQPKTSTPAKSGSDDSDEKEVKMEDVPATEDADAEAEADDEESEDVKVKKIKTELDNYEI
ncbi:uncharacterized protein DSM5745_08417 [Aspergillus mulundensis]|uniref:Uncharacterized protein n=1 Tax=Aspergillus mulundensis TaxID=1810919 RepID=A0A3D8RAB0_9EURO|nr:hypothetical protein DSM5745_08417 [Aspergillus mulundensis]RDW70906.1 hypothetical protein DSM5745_08417 [Aspergillus mulundensis]